MVKTQSMQQWMIRSQVLRLGGARLLAGARTNRDTDAVQRLDGSGSVGAERGGAVLAPPPPTRTGLRYSLLASRKGCARIELLR